MERESMDVKKEIQYNTDEYLPVQELIGKQYLIDDSDNVFGYNETHFLKRND